MRLNENLTLKALAALAFGLLLAILAIVLSTGCGPITQPTPVPTPTPTPPVPAVVCHSVSRSQGDCHQTSEDVYLDQFTAVQAQAEAIGLLYNGEIRNGTDYLQFLIDNLKVAGLCAAIYENEEIAIWNKSDQSFSENWDAIREPGDGRILPRTGPGAHSWTCNPATTENGS